ncbi:MAG: TonB-dependent receptor [Gammaproteobacteria bacterium]|nr:TonB-dependent receptor [Gammaproteobacteria bacterium]
MRHCLRLGCLLLPWLSAATAATPEIVVTAARSAQPEDQLIGNTTRLDADELARQGHTHPAEIGVAVPGAWIARGTEQESLPSIRSPVLTGPGSCGAFLMLEDGVPLRPAGFCNVNGLFESVTSLADSIEVIRGPANALYGANGLHGTLNVLLPGTAGPAGSATSLEAGLNSYWRLNVMRRGMVGGKPAVAGITLDHDADFRADAGYEQGKGFAKIDHAADNGTWQFSVAASWLDQETAGFITGYRAYEDEDLRADNLNPEAYRDADSQRFTAQFTPAADHPWAGTDFRFYLRRSAMDFLQHFLPGQPREENGQVSGGLMLARRSSLGSGTLTSGLDVELASGYLEEFQDNPGPNGSLPQGAHYDYDVRSALIAPFAQIEWPFGDRLTLQAGLRGEIMRYEYDNRMIDGNTQADGTPCTPAPCRYSRPADRDDEFLNVAPNLGLRYAWTPGLSSYLQLVHGFRPPQATELYRLQAQQSVADLDSETLDSAEAGLKWAGTTFRASLAAYAMKKRDVILQDSGRNNVSNGSTRHRGVELEAGFALESGWYGALAASWSKQTYAFDATSPGGELIVDGNDVDTAPRTLAGARLGFDNEPFGAELEWVHVGDHWIDAANEHEYSGHNLLNLRSGWEIDENWSLSVRLNNLADKRYAERADFVSFPAPGAWRYFPGRERELYLELGWRSF